METTLIDAAWIEPSNTMHKIIVVSNHSKTVYQRTVYGTKNEATGEHTGDIKVTTPISVVNYPVKHF